MSKDKVKETQEIKQDKAQTPQEGVDFKKFDYADVFFECNRCGHMTKLDEGVQDGLSFVLPATDKHEWRMVCNNCNNMMRLFFRASSNETIEKMKALEKAKAEAEIKEKQDEFNKKSKEEKPTKGNSKRSKRAAKSDSKREGSADAIAENKQ